MKKELFLRSMRGLCLLSLAAAGVSCAATHSRTQRMQRRVETMERERLELGRRSDRRETAQRSGSRTAAEHEVRLVTTGPVAGGCAEVVVPLRRLDSLPDGARFAAREGRTTVEALRRGDELVVTARSDSAMRRTVRYEYRSRAQRDSCDSSQQRQAERTDSAGRAERSLSAGCEERFAGERQRPARRGRWFAAGLCVGMLLVWALRRGGLRRRLTGALAGFFRGG